MSEVLGGGASGRLSFFLNLLSFFSKLLSFFTNLLSFFIKLALFSKFSQFFPELVNFFFKLFQPTSKWYFIPYLEMDEKFEVWQNTFSAENQFFWASRPLKRP